MHPILLVDDEKDNLEALRRSLRGDYDVTATTSPIEALKLITSQPFNVIISDQRMPEMTGVELLEKAHRLKPWVTRILLTGYTDIESVIDAINRGHIYRYIAKPWDPADLKLTLKQANEAFLLRQEIEEKNRALTRANAELEKAYADLSLLDKAKARFLSLISHELNTPLTVLRSFASLLSDPKVQPGDQKKSAAAIMGATDRFSEIIGEVLTYVRLETETKHEAVEFDLKTSIERVLEEITELAKKAGVKIEKKLKKAVVWGDEDKTRVALRKILTDLVTRTPKQGSLSIELESGPEGAELRLTWPGDALPPEAFRPFETARAELNHHRDLGLGLATAKLILESHRAGLKSEKKAQGLASLKLSFPTVR